MIYLLVQSNNSLYSFSEDFDNTGTTKVDVINRTQNTYKYNFDNKNRISEEIHYSVMSNDSVSTNKYKPEDFDTKIIYVYNEKDQIISQRIISKFGLDSEETQAKYKYDLNGRISKIQFYDVKGEITSIEEYTYNSTEDYVEKVKYYNSDPINDNTRNIIKTFNKGGDEIEKEFIPEFPEQKFVSSRLFYTYEYDNHNNWIKCNVFFEDKKKDEPTLVIERKIEYYN